MTKSIALSSLILGIAIFATSISLFNTSSSHPVKSTKTAVLDEVTVHGDVPVRATNISFNKPIKRPAVAYKVSNKRVGLVLSYNHTLEQGGSPSARTVRVIENL
jgi:hypothetical protein